jgi:type II secretory pathway component PulC
LASILPKSADSTPEAPAPTSSSPLDSIAVQGIFYHASHSSVLIDGKMYESGDQVNGAKVVTIEPSKVVFAYMGEQRVFTLK